MVQVVMFYPKFPGDTRMQKLGLNGCLKGSAGFEMLGEAQTATATAALNGELSSVTFDLNFSGAGASYPADMMVYIEAPNGECVVLGGYQNSASENLSTVVGDSTRIYFESSTEGNSIE